MTSALSGLIDTRTARSKDGARFPNMDLLYGPYASKQEAWTALSTPNASGVTALVKGKTVGIVENGSIVEYWFESAYASISDLVKKNAATSIETEEDDLLMENGTLRLADRSNENGMGYVILRTDKTFAQQVAENNTIYEIRYEFSLASDFTMPSNCTLLFQGGHITGQNDAVLTGTNTRIEGRFDTLKSVMNGVALAGTFTNEQSTFSWWGAYKNDDTKAVHNGNIFKYLVSAGKEITFDGEFYITLGEAFVVNKAIRLNGGTIHWVEDTGNENANLGYIQPDNGFSIIADNVVFYNTGSTKGWLNGVNLQCVIDTIKFTGCSFLGRTRSVTISFDDLDLTNDLGIRNIIINNCYTNDNSRVFTIYDCQFFESFEIRNNTFRNFTEAPIYFASTNSKTYGDKRMALSCVANIKNNTFTCDEPCTSSPIYHCSVVAELNVLNFENNYIEGIASVYNGEDGPHTCYDAYLSCDRLFYRNNIIRNVMGWRTDGNIKDASTYHYPNTEVFKSKGNSYSKVITGNLFEIDNSWLQANNVPVSDNWIYIFVYQHPQKNVIFENNTINIPTTALAGRFAVNSGVIENIKVSNNNITAKSINNFIHTGGVYDQGGANEVVAKSVIITGNTFNVTNGVIGLFRITKSETSLDSVVIKDNQANQRLAMMYSALTYPVVKYFKWDVVTDDYNDNGGTAYLYSGVGTSEISVKNNSSNNDAYNFIVDSRTNTSSEFVFTNLPKKLNINESLTGLEGETKSYTVTAEVVVNNTPLKAEVTVQRVNVAEQGQTPVYELQYLSVYDKLKQDGTVEVVEINGKLTSSSSNILHGFNFYGVRLMASSSSVSFGKNGRDRRDDYTNIKYTLRNNGNSRLFTYDPSKEGDDVELFPIALTECDNESQTYGRIIKFNSEDSYLEYKQELQATKITYLLTQYAVDNFTTNEDAWWSVSINSQNHLYAKIDSVNNCGSNITNVVLRIIYRKGFENSNVAHDISIPTGTNSQVIDLAERIRTAQPSSYNNVTHLTIQGVYSDTASEADTVDISIKVYGITTESPE